MIVDVVLHLAARRGVEGHHDASIEYCRIGGNILAHTLDQVFALGQKKAHERVCFLLKQLSDRLPRQRRHLIELVMTRQDIADYLGLTIETVSRAFGKLKREKVIDIYSAHTVEILDMETVEELALAD